MFQPIQSLDLKNRAAADLTLGNDDLAALDEAFPAPIRKRALEML